MTKGSLRFSPSILVRLGEELIPHPSQGIIELLKNSYDAEASLCKITLDNVLFVGGNIKVHDNGNGMTGEQIINNFLLIGKSEKRDKLRSARLGRRFVGDKGLGRLSAIRLGNSVSIKARPIGEPGVEYLLSIDWSKFDRVDSVEEVLLEVVSRKTADSHGVTIEINDLKKPLSESEVKDLTREAILISDPFAFVDSSNSRLDIPYGNEDSHEQDQITKGSFQAVIDAKEFRDAQERLQAGYLADAAYRLACFTRSDGSGKFKLFDQTQKMIACKDFDAKHFKSIPMKFDLWVYLLGGGAAFSPKKYTLTEIKEWLSSVGGVHFYYRSLRVKPYGDPGDDWLNINLARSRHQENQPSTNTIFGRVAVDDVKDQLIQPTSRIGFSENIAFRDVAETAQMAMRWMFSERSRISEEERQKKREASKKESNQALLNARREIKKMLPATEAAQVIKIIDDIVEVDQKTARVIEEDLQMYRSLATIGTTFTIYAHQAEQPASAIESMTQSIKERGEDKLPELYEKHFRKPVESIREAAAGIRSYTRFPLKHLDRSKRKTTQVNVAVAWQNVCDLLSPIAEKSRIRISLISKGDQGSVFGSVALFEAIAANLITNSIKALQKIPPTKERSIRITIQCESSRLIVLHEDNGLGIREISLDEIWLPGRTTYKSGTGFGLTIVRDSVADLGGTIEAAAMGDFGGATFKMVFPLAKEKK